MFENLSLGHLLVVGIIFLLLFGAKRLPEMGQSLGQGIREFKKSITGLQSDAESRPDVPARAGTVSRSVEHIESERGEPKRLIP